MRNKKLFNLIQAMVKKKTFLLVEVLTAFLLVALCIVPLVRKPLAMFKTELEKLEALELERYADWAFSEVKEKLLKNEIPWEKIPKHEETMGPFFLPDAKLTLPGYREKKISRTFTLYGKGQKDGLQGEDFRQLQITISLGEKKYLYRLPVQKLKNPSQPRD